MVNSSRLKRKGPEQFGRLSRGSCPSCALASTGIVDCGGLILKEKGKESLRKSFHPLIIQKCPWLPGEGVCNLPHSDSPKENTAGLSKPLTAKSPWLTSPALGFFIKSLSPSMTGLPPALDLPETHEVGVRSAALKRSHNASRFLKQTQQRFIRGNHGCHTTRETERHLGPDPGSGRSTFASDLG